MTRPYRVLWLPLVAILLPCAFVGVLGYEWLSLEREAAAHRGLDAARVAAAALERDLREELRAAADGAVRILDEFAAARAPFHPRPRFPALISDASLFDGSRRLLAPDYDRRAQRSVDEYRAASANPVWRRGTARMEALEAAGRLDDALRAADDLLRQAREPGLQASALLALARLSHAAGRTAAAERHAAQVHGCCGGARDEYGTPFVMYAAWQRASWLAKPPRRDGALAAIARDLREAVDLGYLGRAEDVAALNVLAGKTSGCDEIVQLAQRVDEIRAHVLRQRDTVRLMAKWLATVDVPGSRDALPIVGRVRRDGVPSMVAAWQTAPGRWVVIAVDADALAARVGGWAAHHGAFDMSVSQAPSPSPQGLLTVPLFAAATGYDVVVRQRGSDPVTDRRRERLFAGAMIAALALMLFIGYYAVRDVTRELGTAALRANFIAGVTHELKTPLASIRLLAETLRHGRARPETSGELLDTIVEESDRLTRLVDNVLTSSRIDSGARVYHPRPVSVSAVVRSAIRRFDSVIRQEGFSLHEEIDEGDFQVSADPEALERTVLNLLGNAVKYSGTTREIRVRVASDGARARVSVADEGIGVPPSDQRRIFDSFYRSPAAAAHTAGAGLGLALARHFAEAHHGGVAVRSRPGHGSVFTIWLPLVAGDGTNSDR